MEIERFVKLLNDEDLHDKFVWFAQDKLTDRIPEDCPINEVPDDLSDTEASKLIHYILGENNSDTIDDQLVREILEINQLYLRAGIIFHYELVRFDANVDMGDKLSDIFGPLINERFEKIFAK